MLFFILRQAEGFLAVLHPTVTLRDDSTVS